MRLLLVGSWPGCARLPKICTYVGVENVVVAKAFRHQGVGKALMEQIHHWSEERGLKQIQLTVWIFNEGDQGFYRTMGYENATPPDA